MQTTPTYLDSDLEQVILSKSTIHQFYAVVFGDSSKWVDIFQNKVMKAQCLLY